MSTTQEVKTLKKDIAEIKNLLADHAEEGASNGHSSAVITREEIAQMANKAGQSVRSFMSGKREQIGAVKTRTEDTIKARPLTSAAVAMAGGLVIGALLRRR